METDFNRFVLVEIEAWEIEDLLFREYQDRKS